jgi:hypothetical protein
VQERYEIAGKIQIKQPTRRTGRWATFLFVSAMAAADKPAANASKEVTQDTKTTTNAGTNKVSTGTVYGKTESYEPGKSITVSVPSTVSTTKSFDLNAKDESVNIVPNVKVGEWVSVQAKTDNNGHKTVTVMHYSKKGARVKR